MRAHARVTMGTFLERTKTTLLALGIVCSSEEEDRIRASRVYIYPSGRVQRTDLGGLKDFLPADPQRRFAFAAELGIPAVTVTVEKGPAFYAIDNDVPTADDVELFRRHLEARLTRAFPEAAFAVITETNAFGGVARVDDPNDFPDFMRDRVNGWLQAFFDSNDWHDLMRKEHS